jgi:hypothetical protein
MPSDAQLLAARLARIKAIIESLEAVAPQSAEERAIFTTLKAEMDAARSALHILTR